MWVAARQAARQDRGMLRLALAVLLLVAVAPTTLAMPPPPGSLAAVGKWNVEYADNMCLLSRFYGEATAPFALGFKPAPFADSIQIVVVGPSTRSGIAFGAATVVAGSAAPVEGRYRSGPMSKKMGRITAVDIKRSDLDPLAQGGVLAIKAGKMADVAFKLERPAAAFKALDRCVGNLLSWGMDEKAQAEVASYPKAVKPISSYFNDADYPSAALRSQQQGSSGVRYMVGTNGTATDCAVVEPSGSADLDATTCRLLTSRVRFDPALDHAGKPVRSLSYSRVTWMIGS